METLFGYPVILGDPDSFHNGTIAIADCEGKIHLTYVNIEDDMEILKLEIGKLASC